MQPQGTVALLWIVHATMRDVYLSVLTLSRFSCASFCVARSLLGRIMVFRKSPEHRGFLCLPIVQGLADPFDASRTRSARVGRNICTVKVAASLHCSTLPRTPAAAIPGQAGVLPSAACCRRRQSPLQHHCGGLTPPTVEFTPDAQSIHSLPRCKLLSESTVSALAPATKAAASITFAAPRAATRRPII